jgi:hypothetical protein
MQIRAQATPQGHRHDRDRLHPRAGILRKAAWCFYYEGDPDAERRVAAHAARTLRGHAGHVAAAIRRKATTGGFSAGERKNADAAADYLTAKKPYLDYATALARGWPIAVGVIEGACRYLVATAWTSPGARWGLDGAEAVLKLRALRSNGDWEEYWTYHREQEQERPHVALCGQPHPASSLN